MDHQKPSWAWILVLAPLLFVLHLAIFAYRFERIQNVVTGAIFLPAGLVAAAGLIYWLRDSHSAGQKRNTWIGYLPVCLSGKLIPAASSAAVDWRHARRCFALAVHNLGRLPPA